MGNKVDSMLLEEEINVILEETGFTADQIERLYSRFKSLDKSGIGSLSRQDFLRIPELAINPLCDRIVNMFFVDCDEDHDRINFRQFMAVLATFRPQHRPHHHHHHHKDGSNRHHNTSNHNNNNSSTNNNNNNHSNSNNRSAPLLFDTIDPSPFSSAFSKHSRHSSYHDGFHSIHQHHTTNQHSVHYASSTHLALHQPNGHHHHHHHGHHHHHHGHHSPNHIVSEPLVDPEEPPNSRNNKLLFLFKIYDVDDDNLLDMQDLICIIKMMVGTYLDPAIVQKIAERSLREIDKNSDGFIDFKEFCQGLNKDVEELVRVKFP